MLYLPMQNVCHCNMEAVNGSVGLLARTRAWVCATARAFSRGLLRDAVIVQGVSAPLRRGRAEIDTRQEATSDCLIIIFSMSI